MGRAKGQSVQYIEEIQGPEKKKRKHRFRPGTVALREIRTEQRSTKIAIPKRCFQRVVREIVQEQKSDGVRFRKDAMEALQIASEDYLAKLFKDAQMIGLHSGRLSLYAKDLILTRYLRHDM